MSEKNIKTDPLLGNDESQAKPTETVAKPAKVEAKITTPTPKVLTPAAQIKADAIAKFPKDIVAQTKYILENSPQTNFIIPLAEGEAPGTFEEPQINGYKVKVPKGTMVNIPIQIANILAEKYRIQMTAGQEKRIDRASDVSEALS